MITEIEKGIDQDTGLPLIIKRTGYKHNEEAKEIELFYNTYIKYPSGLLALKEPKRHIIQDVPDNEPPITAYTDYCNQFNAEGIGQAIDNFLTATDISQL